MTLTWPWTINFTLGSTLRLNCGIFEELILKSVPTVFPVQISRLSYQKERCENLKNENFLPAVTFWAPYLKYWCYGEICHVVMCLTVWRSKSKYFWKKSLCKSLRFSPRYSNFSFRASFWMEAAMLDPKRGFDLKILIFE